MELGKQNNNPSTFGLDIPQNLRPLDLPQTVFPTNSTETQNNLLPSENQLGPNPVDLSAMKDKINKIMKMENLADITLAGYMIKLLRSKSKMSFRELHDEVSKSYDTLRRSDGTKYTGDLAKALKGCLTSSEIFKEVGDNVWGIREKEAKLYEEKTTKKLKSLIKKKKGRSGRKKESDQEGGPESDDNLSGSDNESIDSMELDRSIPVKKVKYSVMEYQRIYNLLDLSLKKYKGNDDENPSGTNIFETLSDTETPETIMQKFGNDKFMSILDCFEYFRPYIQEALKKAKDDPLSTQKSNSAKQIKGRK